MRRGVGGFTGWTSLSTEDIQMKKIAFGSFFALAIVAAGLSGGCAAAPADDDGAASASASDALQSTGGGGGNGEIDCQSDNACHCRGTADCNWMLNNMCKAYPYCTIEEGQMDCICWTIPANVTAAPAGSIRTGVTKLGTAF
ncbi:MAG TPA: hypothetical protein VIF62_39450 [Labilithrix sp.]|jgi:hypothetical protein